MFYISSCIWVNQRSYVPTPGGSKKVDHSLSFVLGPHTPDNILRTNHGGHCASSPFSDLWNYTCCSLDTRLWWDSNLDSFFFFFGSFLVLLTQIWRAHKLSIPFLCCIALCWDWWLWRPAGLLFPQWLWGSWRRHYKQSLHTKICCTSVALQAAWRCGLETSGRHWAKCTLFSCCSHNLCWVSRSGLWIFYVLYCYCLWVSASCA